MIEDNKKNEASYCWRKVGVWAEDGHRSCPKLKDIVHCRNCEEFTAGGRSLLDNAADPAYINDWTELVANEREDFSESSDSVLVFRLEKEWFAFPAVVFREIDEPKDIHKIPHKTDDVFLGLANIKGELQLCFSLKSFLGIEGTLENSGNFQDSHKRRFMTLERDNYSWVFPADEILGIYKYEIHDVQNVPSTVSNARANYTKNVFVLEGKTIGLLDDELIIYALKRRIM
jgi:chemotaxis-related protein WspD